MRKKEWCVWIATALPSLTSLWCRSNDKNMLSLDHVSCRNLFPKTQAYSYFTVCFQNSLVLLIFFPKYNNKIYWTNCFLDNALLVFYSLFTNGWFVMYTLPACVMVYQRYMFLIFADTEHKYSFAFSVLLSYSKLP